VSALPHQGRTRSQDSTLANRTDATSPNSLQARRLPLWAPASAAKASEDTLRSGSALSAYAVRMQSPPTARIFFSASDEKNLAFTTTGISGSWPLPSTLWMPYLVTSMTTALLLSLAACSRACEGAEDQREPWVSPMPSGRARRTRQLNRRGYFDLAMALRDPVSAAAVGSSLHIAADFSPLCIQTADCAAVGTHLLANQRPKLVQVDNGAEVVVPLKVEVTHTDLRKSTNSTEPGFICVVRPSLRVP
jgi:hypothetical protein